MKGERHVEESSKWLVDAKQGGPVSDNPDSKEIKVKKPLALVEAASLTSFRRVTSRADELEDRVTTEVGASRKAALLRLMSIGNCKGMRWSRLSSRANGRR
jgi:hypothetical protein